MTHPLNRTLAALVFGLATLLPQPGLAQGRPVQVDFKDYGLSLHLRQASTRRPPVKGRLQRAGRRADCTALTVSTPARGLPQTATATWTHGHRRQLPGQLGGGGAGVYL